MPTFVLAVLRRALVLVAAGILVVATSLATVLPSAAAIRRPKPASSPRSVKAIPLAGSMAYEPTALLPGSAGSVWVVGRSVWQVTASGRASQVLPGHPGDIPFSETATATRDGGVSFLGPRGAFMPGALPPAPVLEHVAPGGALTALPVGLPSGAERPFGPMLEVSSGLWGTSWHAPEGGTPAGHLVRIDPLSGAVSIVTLPFAPVTIQPAPAGNFWIGGLTSSSPSRYVVGLVSSSGAVLKAIGLGINRHDNLILSAPAPNFGVWLAVPGLVAAVSPSGQLTAYRPPYGSAELPYGLAAGADGTGWLVAGERSGPRGRIAHGLQLVRLSQGRMSQTGFSVPGFGSDGIDSQLLSYASGKLWAVGGSTSSRTLYAFGVR